MKMARWYTALSGVSRLERTLHVHVCTGERRFLILSGGPVASMFDPVSNALDATGRLHPVQWDLWGPISAKESVYSD